MHVDIDAPPSRVTTILAQVCRCSKFGCYVKILGEYNCKMLRERFLPLRKTRPKYFRITRGNSGCFAAARPDERSPTGWSWTVCDYKRIFECHDHIVSSCYTSAKAMVGSHLTLSVYLSHYQYTCHYPVGVILLGESVFVRLIYSMSRARNIDLVHCRKI